MQNPKVLLVRKGEIAAHPALGSYANLIKRSTVSDKRQK